jgi:hypothetical protein
VVIYKMRILQVSDFFSVNVGNTVVTDPTQPIEYRDLYPHYTDRRFMRIAGQTGYMLVFGEPEGLVAPATEGHTKGGWDSDRISANLAPGFDRKGVLERVAAELGLEPSVAHTTGLFHQEYLREALGSPALNLTHMISWVNSGNGYPGISYRWEQPEA